MSKVKYSPHLIARRLRTLAEEVYEADTDGDHQKGSELGAELAGQVEDLFQMLVDAEDNGGLHEAVGALISTERKPWKS